MNWYSIFILLAITVALVAAVLIALSRHKKSGTGEIHLIGASALVESKLDPEGSVLLDGELWRARSIDGTSIAPKVKVQVVELQGHLLLVKADS